MYKDIKILVVDDEEIFTSILHYLLNPIYNVFIANSGKAAIEKALEIKPDLILLDVVLPDISGFEIFIELKKYEITREIPVIFITGLNSNEEEERGFFLGARDYITKPFVDSIVMARVRTHVQIIKHIRTIEQMCLIDALTNLPNRRSFDERFSLEWKKAVRDRKPVGLLFIDMDRFKHYNDTYGHPFGDMLIQKSGEIYRQTLKRGTDFVARWGGDEFVILLPDTDFNGACEVAENLRLNISSEAIPCGEGETITITISVGVNAILPSPEDQPADFMDKTDKALYAAKAAGRNRYGTYEEYVLQQSQSPDAEDAAQPAETVEPVPRKAEHAKKKLSSYVESIKKANLMDVERAIAAIGGSVELYERILRIVLKAIPGNAENMDKSLQENDMHTFSIIIHDIKGSLNQIGLKELAVLAQALEDASKSNQSNFCKEEYPVFRKQLMAFYKKAEAVTQGGEADESGVAGAAHEERASSVSMDVGDVRKTLLEVKESADDFDSVAATTSFEPLRECRFGEQIDALLEDIGRALDDFEPTKASELIDVFLEKNPE